MSKPAILALEDGSIFYGTSIGIDGLCSGEVVFNTAMTGYQEILTDPSYAQQIVTFTYPHIGNVGTNATDEESDRVWATGLVIRDLPLLASNWRHEQSLQDYLQKNQVVAIADIDTRRLTRILRDKGSLNGAILADDTISDVQALQVAGDFPGLKGMDLAKEVTVDQLYQWIEGSWSIGQSYSVLEDSDYRIVAYDFGVKRNILRMLVDRGCHVTVVPGQTTAEDVLAMNPDGVFLSNGPGDPEPCDYAINSIQKILATNIPVFGICLGHQLLALASGAKTVKMQLGHHGANHPVRNIDDNTVLITSQNHGFAVDSEQLPDNMRVTHTSLFDGSIQGIHRTDKPAFGFQGHPEASPGPHDVALLFDYFIDLIRSYRASY